MIRRRIPRVDDKAIITMAKKILYPFTAKSNPDIEFRDLDVKGQLAKGVTYVLSDRHKAPYGFILLMTMDKDLWILMIAVEPLRQGKGYGTSLIRKAEAYGRSRGCKTVYLYVDEANPRAQHYYSRLGFRPLTFVSSIHCYLLGKELRR